MRYIDEAFEGTQLVPENPEIRATAERWFELADSLDFRLFTFASGPAKVTDLMLNKKLKKLKKYAKKYPELRSEYEAKIADMSGLKNDKSDPEAARSNKANIIKILDEMEETLAHQPFLAGDTYTLADAMWTVSLTRIDFIKETALIEERPHVLAYYRRMQARPSYKKADLWPHFKVSRLPVMVFSAFGKHLLAATVLFGLVGTAVWILWS